MFCFNFFFKKNEKTKKDEVTHQEKNVNGSNQSRTRRLQHQTHEKWGETKSKCVCVCVCVCVCKKEKKELER